MSNVVCVVALVAGWYGLGYLVHRMVQKRKLAGLGLRVTARVYASVLTVSQ